MFTFEPYFAEVGAIPKDGLSKKTNFLVLGEQDLSKLKPGETKSSKHREAELNRESGIQADGEGDSEIELLILIFTQ